VLQGLKRLKKLDSSALIDQRIEKYSKMGVWTIAEPAK